MQVVWVSDISDYHPNVFPRSGTSIGRGALYGLHIRWPAMNGDYRPISKTLRRVKHHERHVRWSLPKNHDGQVGFDRTHSYNQTIPAVQIKRSFHY